MRTIYVTCRHAHRYQGLAMSQDTSVSLGTSCTTAAAVHQHQCPATMQSHNLHFRNHLMHRAPPAAVPPPEIPAATTSSEINYSIL